MIKKGYISKLIDLKRIHGTLSYIASHYYYDWMDRSRHVPAPPPTLPSNLRQLISENSQTREKGISFHKRGLCNTELANGVAVFS